MKIAVASGKGGAGKTSIAASLVLAKRGVLAMDLDVEEPNLGILLGCSPGESRPVHQPVAYVEPDLCSGCGRCAQACAYGAIAWFGHLSIGAWSVVAWLCVRGRGTNSASKKKSTTPTRGEN